jgi:hypothetical protein
MVRKSASQLLTLQRSDGGWGQIAPLPSDAYATGQALVALRQSGIVAPDNANYRRGLQYLLQSQLEDGSWLIRTRSLSFQPYLQRFSSRLRSIHLGCGDELGSNGAAASGIERGGTLTGVRFPQLTFGQITAHSEQIHPTQLWDPTSERGLVTEARASESGMFAAK